MKNPFDFRVLAQWVPPFNKLMEQHAIRLPLQNMALENKQKHSMENQKCEQRKYQYSRSILINAIFRLFLV